MTWLALILYAAAAIGLGWAARLRTASGAAFWTAGRNLGALSVGLSISAGFMSVSTNNVLRRKPARGFGDGTPGAGKTVRSATTAGTAFPLFQSAKIVAELSRWTSNGSSSVAR